MRTISVSRSEKLRRARHHPQSESHPGLLRRQPRLRANEPRHCCRSVQSSGPAASRQPQRPISGISREQELLQGGRKTSTAGVGTSAESVFT
eukprot:6171374-Amphidinium_carterae.3